MTAYANLKLFSIESEWSDSHWAWSGQLLFGTIISQPSSRNGQSAEFSEHSDELPEHSDELSDPSAEFSELSDELFERSTQLSKLSVMLALRLV